VTLLTIYLKSKPAWPVVGFRDEAGKVRIGHPSQPGDCSRPLTEHEIHRLTERPVAGGALA